MSKPVRNENVALVVAYHERLARLGRALNSKRGARDRNVEGAEGIASLVAERQFEDIDLNAAGMALLKIMRRYPDLDMAVIQDLAAEEANVDEETVSAAFFEQTDKGNVRRDGVTRFVVVADEPSIS
jgi:hypothetical protein